MARERQVPRGIRNNNPLNIRIGNVWLGEVKHPTDAAFEQFVAMEYGIRAAFVILRRYIRRYGHDTVRSIVSTWAPPAENDTRGYAEFVASYMGVGADDKLKYEDKETMMNLVAAMAKVECGRDIPIEKIKKGYELA